MGHELIHILANLTGLPKSLIIPELERIVKASNKDLSTLKMDDLREIMVTYMQDVLVNAKSAEG